ncbi:MAG: choice-of-anchor V domain-containing protein [Bryobacteraceae bacterium]
MTIRRNLIHLCGLGFAASLATSLMAFSTGPPPARTGVPADGGATCTACHRGADVNSDTRGKLTILAKNYRPGVKQTIRVMLEHPEAMRWGFQLTARLASDESKAAGSFTPNESIRVQCGGGAPEGNCGGNTEFAEHRQVTTYAGQRNVAVWDVEWTPPAVGLGPVVFYAAGNAANNSANNQGDNIYNTNARFAEESCELTTTPRVTSIRNASFSSSDNSPFQATSPNTLITLGGTGFNAPGVNRAVEGGDISGNQFPTELGCVAVEIAGKRAPLIFVNPTQINAQTPWDAGESGTAEVRVILNPGTPREIRSEPVNLPLTDYSPGFFKLLPTPCIVATFQDGSLTGDPSLFTALPVRGAKSGDILTLYATGLGFTDPVYKSGEITGAAARARDVVSLEFNGTPVPAENILYVGSSPGSISGLFQINLRVPGGARPNSHNQLRLRVGDKLSQGDSTLLIIP